MTRADITVAALDEQTEQRVRIAVSLLPAFRIDARVRAWDGTRCSLLLADVSDAYGSQACGIARRRGTPVISIGDGVEADYEGVVRLSGGSLAPAIAQSIRELLVGRDALSATPQTVANDANALPALCRLSSPGYRGHPVDASLNGRIIRFRPREGRVYASTLSDLLSARDHFLASDWDFDIRSADDDSHVADSASNSLEAFLLQSAYLGLDRLPPFPEGRYRLNDWPDIGSAPELVAPLRIANVLLRAPTSAEELRGTCALDPLEINATLWAYLAADLLDATDERADPVATSRPPGNFSGMLARIARRFGLGA